MSSTNIKNTIENNEPVILAKKDLVESKYFKVQALQIRFANGKEVEFERLINSAQGAVMVIAVQDNHLVMIREYACGVERYELGFVKGRIDPGETWQEAAPREAQEEIGFLPQKLTLLDTLSLAAGYMTHKMYVVLAEDLIFSEAQGDEPEPLEVIRWPLTDWRELLVQAEFSEGRAYAGLMLALKHLNYI